MAVPEVYVKVKGHKSILADWFIGAYNPSFEIPTKFTKACGATWETDHIKEAFILIPPNGVCEQRLSQIRLALKELEILGYGKFLLKGEDSLAIPEEHEYTEAFKKMAVITNFKGSLL
jgi:hypothetical protein